jgi:hypothetical protein
MGRNKKKIYSIILTNHGKRKETLYSDTTEEKIYKKFNSILKENKKVVFPMRYNNEKHVMVESDHELYIIKCKEFWDSDVNKIKDESGKYINYESSDEDWIILDRASYDVEETFFVYGYHPKLQRKTFEWIFNEFISKDAKNKYLFKSIQIYLNKVLIDCNGKLDIVICKNKSDAIRFYNKIEEWCKERKYKYILFMGDIDKSKYKTDWIDRIQKLTNWPRAKIVRHSTRP